MTGFLDANDEPGVHAPSLYAATATTGLRLHPLDHEIAADVAVVGGGFAGLSAAYHLANAGFDVALIDAHRIGWGASGRNGGQLAAVPRKEIDWYERVLGVDDARKIFALALEANALVRALIERHAISCDLHDGILEPNHRRSYDAETERYVDKLRNTYKAEQIEYVPPAKLPEYLRAEGYHGGLMNWRAAQLHPLNFALGLAIAAQDAGARLFPMTRATAIDIQNDAVAVETPVGAVRAKSLVLAVNGYHDGVQRKYADRVMPINNFIIATEPLGDRAKEVIPGDVAVADSRFAINYFRLSRDGRMVFGGGENASAHFPRDLSAFVRKRMLKVFPTLEDARVDYAWGGTLGISQTRAPVFQRLGPNALAIGGWSGSGVHMATLGGKIAAETLQGQLESFDLLARVPTPLFPGGMRFRGPILRLAMAWYRLLDHI